MSDNKHNANNKHVHSSAVTNEFGFTHEFCSTTKTLYCLEFKLHDLPIEFGSIWAVCCECDSDYPLGLYKRLGGDVGEIKFVG